MKDIFADRSFKNKYIIAAVVTAVIIVVTASLVAYGCVLINSRFVLDGVYMNSVDLSGCTRDEAAQLIYDSLQIDDTEILFECDGESFAVSSVQTELAADAEGMADKAYNIGKVGNPICRIWEAYCARLFGKEIQPAYIISETKLAAAISDNLADRVTDTTPYCVEIVSDGLLVHNGIAGRGVAQKDISERIFNDIADNGTIDNTISLTITDIPAQPIIFEEFCSEYIREARDATYTTKDGEYVFTPEVEGISFDIEQARDILAQNVSASEPYHIPATITMPEVTVAQLQSKFAVDVLGTYTTNYASSDANRASNVALAASKINGVVLNPGQRFSFNGIVGPRTVAAGFKVAHVYEGDRVVDGLGGGICQVSSTLYNAVLLADLKIVYRTNHSMPVAYVPKGRDATVSYGTIDFIFENNKKHPVTIVASTYNRNLTISVKGVNENRGTTIEIYTENAGYTAYSTRETVDNSLAPGEKKVVKSGSNGSIYNSYKIYKKDGAVIKTEHIARSNYIPVAQIVAVGPAKAEDTQPVEPVVKPVEPGAGYEQTENNPPADQQPEQDGGQQTDHPQVQQPSEQPPEDSGDDSSQSDGDVTDADIPVSADPVMPDGTSSDESSDSTDEQIGNISEDDAETDEII